MKKKFGDRKDGTLLRDQDAMHFIMPLIYPNRCDNEAFISECVDLTNVQVYLEKLNADNPEYKYNLFQILITALLKTFTLRPKLNRFIANKNTYQRNDLTAAFIIKKVFADNGGEGPAFLHAEDGDTIFTVHEKIYKQITDCRSDKLDSSSESMELFNKMPRFLSKAIVRFICFLDRHGKVPQSLIDSDPYYSSVMLTNLGSIKLHSGYHHLTNWGTNSFFCIVGERKKRPFYEDDGSFTMRDSVDIGMTVDERIADGYYFSRSIKLFLKLMENPELLERPLAEEVDY